MSSEQIEDIMSLLSEMGITVIESEEQEEAAADADSKESAAAATGNLNDDDIRRPDAPVRKNLRAMDSVELLTLAGAYAVAQPIKADPEQDMVTLSHGPS